MTGRQSNPTSIDQDISRLMGSDPAPSEAASSSDSSPEPETIPLPSSPQSPWSVSSSPEMPGSAMPEPEMPDTPSNSIAVPENRDIPAASSVEPTVTDSSLTADVDQPPSFTETVLQPGMVPTEPDTSTVSIPDLSEPANVAEPSDAVANPMDVPSAPSPMVQPPTIPIDQEFLHLLTQYQRQHGEAATQQLLSRALIEYEQRNGVPGTNEVLRRLMQSIQEREGADAATGVVSDLRQNIGEAPLPETGSADVIERSGPEPQTVPPPPVNETNETYLPIVPKAMAGDDSDRQNLLNFLPLALVAAIAGTALAFTLLRRQQDEPLALIALPAWDAVVPIADTIVSQLQPPSSDPSPPVTDPVDPAPDDPDLGTPPDDPDLNDPPPPNPDLETDKPPVNPSFNNPGSSGSPPLSPSPSPSEPLPGVPLW